MIREMRKKRKETRERCVLVVDTWAERTIKSEMRKGSVDCCGLLLLWQADGKG